MVRTTLDDAKTWFLHGIAYQDELQIIVAEGIESDQPEKIRFGDKDLSEGFRLDITDRSRFIDIRFPPVVAWQVVDESYSEFDDYEEGDKGFIRVLERSRYFDYVKKSHDLFEAIIGPAKHYRIWTENEVIDVIACEAPAVESWEGEHLIARSRTTRTDSWRAPG